MTLEKITKDQLVFRPLTANEWPDFLILFEEHGPQNGCWCMYWRVKREDCHRQFGEGNKLAFKRIVDSGKVPGILAYLDRQPVGWCSIAPREQFSVLDRSLTLKRIDDQPVWSIVCFFVAKAYRRRGLTSILIQAAIEYARACGAEIIEAYPLKTEITKLLPSEVRLPDEVATAVFRITQEALNNAIQHADASEIEVRLTHYPDRLRLTVTDDGRGITGSQEPGHFVAQGHLGLAGMRERAAMIGAKLEVQSATDYGTAVVLEIPN